MVKETLGAYRLKWGLVRDISNYIVTQALGLVPRQVYLRERTKILKFGILAWCCLMQKLMESELPRNSKLQAGGDKTLDEKSYPFIEG